MLAEIGDLKAKDYLARVGGDAEFPLRGLASVVLARTKDKRALDWVPTGLASTDSEERKQAIAICGLLGDTEHTKEIAGLATDDADPAVRLTAAATLL